MSKSRSTSKVQLTRAGLLRIAVASLEKLGEPAEPYLRRAKLLPHWADGDSDALVPLLGYYRFLELVERDVEGFGAVVGDAPLDTLGTLGRTLGEARTVRDALNRATRCAAWLGAAHSGRLYDVPTEPGVWFCRCGSLTSTGGTAQGELLVLRFVVQLVRSAAGSDWKPQALQFRSREEAMRAVAHTEAFQGVPAAFGAGWGGLRISRDVLELPMRRRPGGSAIELDELEPATLGDAVSPNLRRLLLSAVRAGGDLSLDSTAEMLGLHPRHLQRQLAAERTSYRRIVDEARFVRSHELISHSDLPLTQVALEVGYSDLSNFNRAFRRWAGTPPGALRSA